MKTSGLTSISSTALAKGRINTSGRTNSRAFTSHAMKVQQGFCLYWHLVSCFCLAMAHIILQCLPSQKSTGKGKGSLPGIDWPFQTCFRCKLIIFQGIWAVFGMNLLTIMIQKSRMRNGNDADVAVRQHLQNLGLQTASGLTGEVLKRTYHKCALIWHPDKHCRDEGIRTQAEEKFKTIKSSYQFLQAHIDK